MRRALAATLVLPALALGGCTSTQDKADELAASGKQAFEGKGVRVTRENPDVDVVGSTVLTDANGSAAVVVVRNTSTRLLTGLPVAIDVRAGGTSVFRNDATGLEPSLTTLTALGPKATSVWVNDQVTATAEPDAVTAKVGAARGAAPSALPKLTVQDPRLEDSGTGPQAVGFVRNASKVEQRELVLYGVARKGERIVAAGRAQVRRVRAGARASFRMFFIGDPRGADLQIDVPPTSLTD